MLAWPSHSRGAVSAQLSVPSPPKQGSRVAHTVFHVFFLTLAILLPCRGQTLLRGHVKHVTTPLYGVICEVNTSVKRFEEYS